MKIVHICLNGSYTDGFDYQDNLLSKYHKKMVEEVILLAPQWSHENKGKLTKTEQTNYINNDGVRVIRVPQVNSKKDVNYKFKRYKNFYDLLGELEPDIIFLHNLQMLDSLKIVKYMRKNPKVKLYVDNHADFSNSATNFLSKNILHKLLWKFCAHKLIPYVERFYGVMPARVDFLENIYGIPSDKTELLVMGADDECVERAATLEVKRSIRERFQIGKEDFLIVTGGKIDAFKTQTLLLMEAVQNIKSDKIKLLVFGSVDDNLKERLLELSDGKKVQYIGWARGEEPYRYFASADLVVFPGRHSVYWEQVVAQGIPMICKYWDGTTHVDIGGNVEFLYKDSTEEIQGRLEKLINNYDKYQQMKDAANGKRKKNFLYSRIARKSVYIEEK